ncbi:aldehyde dehydrogenase [Curtobacterium sp. MCSS17_008]|uniref:aldehyde dehydrogenase n=1 Tax=Curtobacterium sp. MCSS17_008 TaxID=2175647 RepID=UPI000DAAB15E|nr:aldehyde dehydrogenase [Curtobacterium sp. MCSS17_008]PZF57724.1 aldehyde dehydrogenase [Curtobacterium sp. MCSS17_008]
MDTTAMMRTMPTDAMPMTLDGEMVQDTMMTMNAASMAATMCSASDVRMGGEMATCAAMCANTAMLADTAMRMLMRPEGMDAAAMRTVLEACVAMGSACAAECHRHAEMDEACRYCAMACDEMVASCRTMLDATTD